MLLDTRSEAVAVLGAVYGNLSFQISSEGESARVQMPAAVAASRMQHGTRAPRLSVSAVSWRTGEKVQELQDASVNVAQLQRQAAALLGVAHANLVDESLEGALAALDAACTLFREAGLKGQEADALLKRALLLEQLARARPECRAATEEALAAAAEALRLSQDERAQANALSLLAQAHLLAEDAGAAQSFAERAAQLFRQLGDKRMEAAVLLTLAKACLLSSKLLMAVEAMNVAKLLCLEMRDLRGAEAAQSLLNGSDLIGYCGTQEGLQSLQSSSSYPSLASLSICSQVDSGREAP